GGAGRRRTGRVVRGPGGRPGQAPVRLGAVTAPLGVVVVDDSAVQRRFLRSAIEAADEFAVVGEARNGAEAVALVERLRPAAVVMDLDLPVMGGVEAIERVLATGRPPIEVRRA